MSTKRDLVEAHSFNRRRLVTAFISGAPGGREVEPVRPARTLVGGAVLAALVLVGALVYGFLDQPLPDDWKERGLVIGEDTGARYLAADGSLFPVINTTSARLLLDDVEVQFVPDDVIARENPGTTIGILGAPDALPDASNLIQSGWTACADADGNTLVRLVEDTEVTGTSGRALVAVTDGTTYVVVGGTRYPVAERRREATLRALGLRDQTAQPVPGVWADLFASGSPLEPFTVPGSGQPVDPALRAPGAARVVGSTLRVDGQAYVLARDGLVPLDPFAYALYRSDAPGSDLPEVDVEAGEVADVPGSALDPVPSDWPRTEVTSFVSELGPCASLRTESGRAATVSLAAPTSDAMAPDRAATGTRSARVANGHGAVVRAYGGGVVDRGTIYLVDASGTRYAIGSPTDTTLERLGYAGVDPAPVPLPWMDLFADGPVLDSNAARLPPGRQP